MMQKIDTKNKIYIGLCVLYLLLSIINMKYPIKNIFLGMISQLNDKNILLFVHRFVFR